ncbi:MAG: phosphatase PAP2 family protein [Anaerolineae bacterium]
MMHEVQLQWIRNLQEALRSSWMDGFFKAWNFVDTAYFSIIAISLVWYLWDRRIGIRLFYILVISLVLNKLLKSLFDQPRPCQVDPLVGILCSASPGFPSGAAQTAAIFCGVVFIECRRPLYRWMALAFAFFLCFSRVYLGVHYPTDILGGLVVGSLLLVMYAKIFPLFQKIWKVAAIAFPFLLLFLGLVVSMSSFWVFYLFFSTLGIAVGLMTYAKQGIQKVETLRMRGWQTLIVIVGLCILFVMEQLLPSLEILWSFGEGYWLSFLGGCVAKERRLFTK